MLYSLEQLNCMSQEEFVDALGVVFEETPAIARRVYHQRPFASVIELHQQMVAVVKQMSSAEQLALICAHPDLGSKTKMAEASVQEQADVGLDQLTASEFERFQILNSAYKAKFGFPFIIAVKNQTKDSILESFARRLNNTAEIEVTQSLAEIAQIAHFRLLNLIDQPE
ncbi:MAG: 2-oxo-4-hydroxy-4-carboxy-5-ureidoimidazoline decarboxylase [Leptolyngbyaceae cyanobacterium SL_5_14]|nr:2-oxo-4-hydroxy-4-carboxy-5-ureidoimidazoline decarboxylase [Leptolyngbyaceae cyanobacterium SL_5_14]